MLMFNTNPNYALKILKKILLDPMKGLQSITTGISGEWRITRYSGDIMLWDHTDFLTLNYDIWIRMIGPSTYFRASTQIVLNHLKQQAVTIIDFGEGIVHVDTEKFDYNDTRKQLERLKLACIAAC